MALDGRRVRQRAAWRHGLEYVPFVTLTLTAGVLRFAAFLRRRFALRSAAV
jgi:hypothetical protein